MTSITQQPNRQLGRLQLIWSAASILAVILFVALELFNVFTVGVCCADDALFAGVAKNLADGLGYTSTLPLSGTRFFAVPFDPLVGSGPTIILPTALLIRLLGNTYWVPGLSLILTWAVLLLVIGWCLRRYNPGVGLAAATFVFLVLAYSTPWVNLAWYVLLGEVPAALLIVLAVLLACHSNSRQVRTASGLAFALAVLAKTISVGAIIAFLSAAAAMWAMSWRFKTPIPWRHLLENAYTFGLGFMPPFALFEAWKLATMGLGTYLDRLKVGWAFVFGWGFQAGNTTNPLHSLVSRLEFLHENFGFELPAALGLLTIAWLMVRRIPGLQRLFAVFALMAFSYWAWWIFLSNGWPRYFIISLVILYVLFALPFLRQHPSPMLLIPYLLLLGVWWWGLLPNLRWRVRQLQDGNATRVQDVRALIQVSDLLAQSIARREPIVTRVWTSAADLEYIMDTHGNFINYLDRGAYGDEEFMIALNTKWEVTPNPEFDALLAACQEQRRIGPYLVARCPPLRP